MRLIDADAFRDKRKNAIISTHERYGCEVVEYIDIINAPTINPAGLVPKGRWIVDECDSGELNGYSAFIEFHCPFCNEPYTLESGEYNWYYGDDIPLKFCHECGADMRGDGDG